MCRFSRRSECEMLTDSTLMENQIENITFAIGRANKNESVRRQNLEVKTSGNFCFRLQYILSCYPMLFDTLMQFASNVFRLLNRRHGQIDTASLCHVLTCSFQLCIYSLSENHRAKQKLASKQDVPFPTISLSIFIFMNQFNCAVDKRKL